MTMMYIFSHLNLTSSKNRIYTSSKWLLGGERSIRL